jgi:hypothetical protein
MVGVLREAWTRQIRLPELPGFVRECISTTQVPCECVESTEDQLDALCENLQRDFGFRSTPIHADRLVPVQIGPVAHERIPAELRAARFLVTTVFHAAAIRSIARTLEKPLIVVRLDPAFVREVQKRLTVGELTVICVDPRFLERIRVVVGGEHAERIRGVLANDQEAIQNLDPRTPVLATHAAQSHLSGISLPPLLPDRPLFSRESAEELAEALVRFNLEAMKQSA